MDTLNFVMRRYGLNPNASSPVRIPASRWHDMGRLLNDLGFKKGVELGVYRGRFTERLASRAPNVEIIGIDAWTSYENYRDYDKNDLENDAYQHAQKKLARFKNVTLKKAWSLDAVKEFPDESLDWVFIDANHSYEHVVADIAAWSRKVRKGGLVIGHDYFVNSKLNFGVIEAVNGWCSAYGITPLFTWKDKCPSWMYVKT
ncbi:TPA: hypothetical protein DIV48_00565 [Candidatus Kaiserbacteria bacterium]|nr:MAG: hypothetical protein UY93_C0002G0426 [Parcubacteria group bacterium GW2011_GWA1_56_13]KKW45680.1 MAG: hypothetical protein UY97_C0017G0010 [Parcubacteria group bacterium GW2011_GWB1_57_6]HCR52124.1 hypothetical protein [Candidatus Kaiserbacteria bacterium]